MLLEFEDVHLMDRASANLLAALVPRLVEQPWLVAVTRRDEPQGFVAPAGHAVLMLEPGPLSGPETIALAELATERAPLPPSVLEARRGALGRQPAVPARPAARRRGGRGRAP